MPQFDVRLSDGGAVATRRVEAADAQAVAARLGVPAARILAVLPVQPPAAATARAMPARAFPLRLFSQELSVLLGAGLPLLEALVTLREKEGNPRVAAALDAVAQRLQQGEALSAALAARPEAFDGLFAAVVASAERTGQLREALGAHARYLAWMEELRARLLGASLYPLMLLAAGSAVLVFLLVFVVPRFAGLLEEVGRGDLPAASRWLIMLGGLTGEHPAAAIAVAVALLAAPLLAWRHGPAREAAAAALWAVPTLGDKLRLLALARLYRTLGMLLDAGVPVVPALANAGAVVVPRLRAALAAVREAVSRGERLSAALEREGLGTPVSVRMVRVGERSGTLGPMLGQAAAFYDEELTRLSDLVSRLINPLLMLVMGVVIGGVIVLMYLPIFQLMEQVQ